MLPARRRSSRGILPLPPASSENSRLSYRVINAVARCCRHQNEVSKCRTQPSYGKATHLSRRAEVLPLALQQAPLLLSGPRVGLSPLRKASLPPKADMAGNSCRYWDRAAETDMRMCFELPLRASGPLRRPGSAWLHSCCWRKEVEAAAAMTILGQPASTLPSVVLSLPKRRSQYPTQFFMSISSSTDRQSGSQ